MHDTFRKGLVSWMCMIVGLVSTASVVHAKAYVVMLGVGVLFPRPSDVLRDMFARPGRRSDQKLFMPRAPTSIPVPLAASCLSLLCSLSFLF